MKLIILKILYLLSLATILFYISTNIYNTHLYNETLKVNGYFILTIISSIILPFAIFYISNKNIWFALSFLMLITTISCWLCLKSDLLQKTIFINQSTSTYKLQKKTTDFIDNNHRELIQLTKKLEAKIKSNKFENDIEIIIINKPNHLKEKDTIEVVNKNASVIKKRLIITDLSRYGLDNKFQIKNFTVKNNKIQRLSIYNYGLTFYPFGVTDSDKKAFSQNEVLESGTNLYLDNCLTKSYIYTNQWLYKIGGCG